MLTKINSKVHAHDLICQGEYEAAAKVIGWSGSCVIPERGTLPRLAYAQLLLDHGAVTLALGSIQKKNVQTAAKDMLTRSARLFGERSGAMQARTWLAWVYYWTGEYEESLAVVETVLAEQPDEETRFRLLLVKAIVCCEKRQLGLALVALAEIETIYDNRSLLQKGKFHMQRGRVFRLMGEAQRAVDDYDRAAEFFIQGESRRFEATISINLAGAYLDLKQFILAHNNADRACSLFHQLKDLLYEAKAWDQTAQIYLAENKLENAERAARKAVSLLDGGDQSAALAECLITHGAILGQLGMRQALSNLHRARELCEQIGDRHQTSLAYEALRTIVRQGKALAVEAIEAIHPAEILSIRHALANHNGVVFHAAKELGITEGGLRKKIRHLQSQGVDLQRSPVRRRPYRSTKSAK